MLAPLNWKEIAALVDRIRPEIEGLFVDRVVVPERPRFPEGYLRNEWVLRLTGKRAEAALFFSVRPRHPYLAWALGKGPHASTRATQSPFSLGLSKQLKGARITGIEALPRERIVVLRMAGDLALIFCLIPAVPEALLVRAAGTQWPILCRSRTLKTEEPFFRPPQGGRAPENPAVRAELFARPESYHQAIERELGAEAFEQRFQGASRVLRGSSQKQARQRLHQSKTSLQEARGEADWSRYGELLKARLHELPEIPALSAAYECVDAETGERVSIPADPRLAGPREQTEKFFQLARRQARRAEEARLRIETFELNLGKWEAAASRPPEPGDWARLEELERLAGMQPHAADARAPRAPGKGKVSSWLGKTFTSKDGLLILAGRSKDENLELTFKHARGNDLWLHVRGRPGAHVLIPLGSGKTAPLETLLDAATLAIYYSGGEKWGKTEVDYAFKKHVRRIKDSTEASYTHNKTLLIEPDAARIRRLLGVA